MKKIYLIIFIIYQGLLFATNDKIDEKSYFDRFSKILDRYEIFMDEHGKPDTDYYKAFILYREKLHNEESHFSLDFKNNKLLDNGAMLRISKEDGSYHISVGYKLVDIYTNYPSVVFSILTHEIWHAYAYITNPSGFLEQDSDPFEDSLYEIDAIITEGFFVNEVIISSGLIPSKYEDYLNRCIESKNINNFTSALLKVDYYLVDDLYKLRNNFFKNPENIDLNGELLKISSALIEDYKEIQGKADDFQKYKYLVALSTYKKFSTLILEQYAGKHEKYKTWDDIFLDFPNFYGTYQEITNILDDDSNNFINDKYREYIDYFNKDLL